MRQKLVRQETEMFVASVEDIVASVVSTQEHMINANATEDWVLKGLRRNVMMSYRPTKSGFQVVTGNESEAFASWAKDMPEGSARQRAEWFFLIG